MPWETTDEDEAVAEAQAIVAMHAGLPLDEIVPRFPLATPPQHTLLCGMHEETLLEELAPLPSRGPIGAIAPNVIDLNDFIAAPNTPLDWLVEDLVLMGSVTEILGDRGSMKSLLSNQLAFDVACGKPCLGQFPTNKQGTVLIVDMENPEPPLRVRLGQMARGNAATGDVPIKLYRPLTFDIMKQTDLENLKAAIHAASPILIIFDCLRRIHRKEENSSQEMAEIMDRLMILAHSTGAAVVFVHHTPKDGKTSRGSGDIEAALDTGLLVTAIGNGRILIKHGKYRWTEPVDDFQVKLVKDPTSDGLRVEFDGWAGQVTGTKVAVACAEIENLLKTGDMSQKALCDALEQKGISRSTTRRATDELVDNAKKVVPLDRQGKEIPLHWTG